MPGTRRATLFVPSNTCEIIRGNGESIVKILKIYSDGLETCYIASGTIHDTSATNTNKVIASGGMIFYYSHYFYIKNTPSLVFQTQ